ncbi:U3 small nucleolar RNA-associated protein 18 homolog [Euwallacea similis]|uniref:U3 small nucleolar RNA-associated protein 18 homolog n=1 Tax=Euwallacea similis TaxID=1736056 RepID=UPI00344D0B87
MPKQSRKRKSTRQIDAEDTGLTSEKIRHKAASRDECSDDIIAATSLESNFYYKDLFKNIPQQIHLDSGVESGTSEDSDNQELRKPAWSDEDDAGIDVGEALDSQNRKLPSGGINDRSNKYSSLLKHKFESIVGTPNWAKLDKNKSEDSDEEILHTAGFISKPSASSLPAGSIEFKKVKDLNSETYNEGTYINAIEFHPTSSVGLVAGNKGVASLFAVDGKKNNKLHSVAFERFPILCAKFIKNGDEAMLGSRHGHMYIYDLMSAKALRYNLPPGMTHCKNFVVSPDSQFIAVAGKWGEVHILSSVSKERIALLKQDNEVTSMKYNSEGSLLFGHSDTGEVTIWDVNTRRVRHKFLDEGCLQGSALATSSSNQFLACGSAQGVVNLYGMEDALKSKLPKPRKTIMNLTTAITGLEFNASSELLALAATDIKNSIKLFHIASGSVFSNFPPFQSKLGHLNCINFSPGTGYLALGNRNSKVSLFRLKHFKNY